MNSCGKCGAAAGDAYVCKRCMAELREHLEEIPDLTANLEISITRQAAIGRAGKPGLPWDERASRAEAQLHNALAGWVRILVGDTWPADTIPAMAQWLIKRLPAIRQHGAGAEGVRDIGAAVRHGWDACDRVPPHIPLGLCGAETDPGIYCPEQLHARPDAVTVECRRCGDRTPVAERHDVMMQRAQAWLGTATELAEALKVLGIETSAAAIRGYAHRKRIRSKGRDRAGDPMYRLGDVLKALARRRKRARATVST